MYIKLKNFVYHIFEILIKKQIVFAFEVYKKYL